MPKIQFLTNDDDWTGLYIDGKLIIEGHSIRARDVVEALGYKYESKVVEFVDGSSCPETFPEDPPI